jgi:hypothetical protein
MLYLLAFQCALYLAGIHPGSDGAPSYLKSDEARWAKRLGLKQSYVRKIVEAAGYSQDNQVRLEDLDVRHLRPRKHVFLVMTAGNGHCLTLIVIAQKTGFLQKVWEAAELPGGAGFCHDGARTGNFTAHATEDGVIIVDVPKDEEGHYVLEGTKRLVYKWNGKTYALSTLLEP